MFQCNVVYHHRVHWCGWAKPPVRSCLDRKQNPSWPLGFHFVTCLSWTTVLYIVILEVKFRWLLESYVLGQGKQRNGLGLEAPPCNCQLFDVDRHRAIQECINNIRTSRGYKFIRFYLIHEAIYGITWSSKWRLESTRISLRLVCELILCTPF